LFACGCATAVCQVGRKGRERRVAVFGDQGIEVDDVLDVVRHTVGHAGYHHATIGMADQDDVAEFLCREEVGDVQHVRADGDLLRQEVGTLTEAGQGWSPNAVTKR